MIDFTYFNDPIFTINLLRSILIDIFFHMYTDNQILSSIPYAPNQCLQGFSSQRKLLWTFLSVKPSKPAQDDMALNIPKHNNIGRYDLVFYLQLRTHALFCRTYPLIDL